MARARHYLGFSIRIRPRPDVAEIQARQFLRDLEDWFEVNGLQAEGTQLHWRVVSAGRDTLESDLVSLLDWLRDQEPVSEVWARWLTHRGFVGRTVAMQVKEPGSSALTRLYRLGWVSPAMYLQILRRAADARR